MLKLVGLVFVMGIFLVELRACWFVVRGFFFFFSFISLFSLFSFG